MVLGVGLGDALLGVGGKGKRFPGEVPMGAHLTASPAVRGCPQGGFHSFPPKRWESILDPLLGGCMCVCGAFHVRFDPVK